MPDTQASVPTFLHFLRTFLRTRDPKHSLPTVEIMTILKNEKPTIFYYLKKQAKINPSLEILTAIDIDYNLAVSRLNELKIKIQ